MYDERCLKIIGANIKLIRICCGISQGELARSLAISQTHLSNIECCRVTVNFRVLLRAANTLDLYIRRFAAAGNYRTDENSNGS